MRLLVTGAAGQLGTELVHVATSAGHEVVGVDRAGPGPAGGEVRAVDLTVRDAVVALVEEVRPDAVVHAAAHTKVDLCESEPEVARAVNVDATRNVAEGARAVGAHVVYVSTDYVFDGTKATPYVETDEPSPVSVYGATKLAGERELDPGWTVARTSWVCGYWGHNMVRTVLRLAAEHETLRFVDDQVGRPTFTSDLAPMLLRLAEDRAPGVFHTTNGREVSWYGFVREVMASAGLDPDRVRPVRTEDLDPQPAARRPANSVLDSPAWRAQGYPPARDHREPLDELVARLLAD